MTIFMHQWSLCLDPNSEIYLDGKAVLCKKKSYIADCIFTRKMHIRNHTMDMESVNRSLLYIKV